MSWPSGVLSMASSYSGSDSDMFGHMGWGMTIWWLPLLVAILALTVVTIRERTPKADGPLDTLARRFAMGEIDAAEYEERRKTLEQ